jgi:hypothetical protein
MKRYLLILGGIFAAALGVTMGLRLSADALAVMVGVTLGVATSVPTTGLLVYFLIRGRQIPDETQRLSAYPQPPVVVINASDRPGWPGYASPPPMLPSLTAPGGGRKWTVIGDSETE